ncbi:MAG: hypothetical protein ABH869_05655 [Candidatus Omnitrophota bacterium]
MKKKLTTETTEEKEKNKPQRTQRNKGKNSYEGKSPILRRIRLWRTTSNRKAPSVFAREQERPRQYPEVENRNKVMVFATMAQMAFSFSRNFLTLFFELFKVLNELALIVKRSSDSNIT